MIRIDKENFKIETDCKTVGEFMTEAAAIGLSVKVSIDDNDNYFFEGGQKVKVVDDTPIDKVLFDRTDYTLNARASFRVLTKPKPKTVTCVGWANVYAEGNFRLIQSIYDTKEDAMQHILVGHKCVATTQIKWEEVSE